MQTAIFNNSKKFLYTNSCTNMSQLVGYCYKSELRQNNCIMAFFSPFHM